MFLQKTPPGIRSAHWWFPETANRRSKGNSRKSRWVPLTDLNRVSTGNDRISTVHWNELTNGKFIYGILGNGVSAVIPEAKGKGKKRASEAGSSKAMKMLIKDFGIEYAKSSRSSCAGCHLKIAKDEVRIKKVSHDSEIGMKFGGQAVWHHVECFAQLRSELGWFESAEALPGFKSLSKDDQQTAKKHVP